MGFSECNAHIWRETTRSECACSGRQEQQQRSDETVRQRAVVNSVSTQPRIWWLSRHSRVAVELCVDSATDLVAQSTQSPGQPGTGLQKRCCLLRGRVVLAFAQAARVCASYSRNAA